jgi:hypothetical protein
MQGLVFAVMVGLGVYSLHIWAVRRVAVYPMTLLSASVWSWLALRGTRITSNMQGAYTEVYPYLGYVWLFLALASLLAMFAHYLWGLPRTGDREEAANADQTETED